MFHHVVVVDAIREASVEDTLGVWVVFHCERGGRTDAKELKGCFEAANPGAPFNNGHLLVADVEA